MSFKDLEDFRHIERFYQNNIKSPRRAALDLIIFDDLFNCDNVLFEHAVNTYCARMWNEFNTTAAEIRKTLTKKPINATKIAIACNNICANWSQFK